MIEVRETAGKGRGVFATELIPEGTVFERVPVLVIPTNDVIGDTYGELLQHYVFEWGKGTVAIALGCGSMYNHSYGPNARYDDKGRRTKIFTALRDIYPGEEITVNYNGDEEATGEMPFEVQDPITTKKSQPKKTQAAPQKELAGTIAS